MAFLKIQEALDKAYRENEKEFELNEETKIVIFSDLHRGVGDSADDFVHNAFVFANALDYYFKNGFTYIELGDGDELYENRKFVEIVRAYGNIFRLINKFHKENRFCYILGNHNFQMGDEKWLKKSVEEARTHIHDLFFDIEIFKSAILGDEIFLFHGHQGDPINDRYASVGRFWVRNVWKPLQSVFGFKDPTRPSENIRKRNKVENAILDWASKNHMVSIAGHTHRPMFCSLSKQQRELGEPEKPYYFNCGSGVHPRCVTFLEIKEMTIELVKWHIVSDLENDGRLKVVREPKEKCKKHLSEIFSAL